MRLVDADVTANSAGAVRSVSIQFIQTHLSQNLGGGRVVRWCWVNFQCQGVLLIWIVVGQGLTALAVGAGGGCLDSRLSFLSSFFLSLGDGPI